MRRPLAALVTALALVGASSALSACTSASEGVTGTPADNVAPTPGAGPPSDSLPHTSNRVTSSGAGRAAPNGPGQP